jgi:energy-coupling factor transporter ATP-binding protein EcfA2
MFNYITHGLKIQSEIEFPELKGENSHNNESTLNKVKISLGKVDSSKSDIISEGIFRVASRYILTKNSVYVIWNDTDVCEIRHSNQIIVNNSSQIEENFLRSLILGPALGILLHRHNRLILHASAVNINGEAVAIMGHNGMGKSTTTMALIARGYPLIADDILSVEFDQKDNPAVYPGIGRIKLWPRVYNKYKEKFSNMNVIHSQSPKRSCQLKEQSTSILPLKHIYILEKSSKIGLSELNYSESLIELIRNSYCANIFQEADEKSHFQEYAEIVRRVPIKYLNRYDSLSELEQLAEIIEKDVQSNKDQE